MCEVGGGEVLARIQEWANEARPEPETEFGKGHRFAITQVQALLKDQAPSEGSR